MTEKHQFTRFQEMTAEMDSFRGKHDQIPQTRLLTYTHVYREALETSGPEKAAACVRRMLDELSADDLSDILIAAIAKLGSPG